jgi:hypothetical protein
MGQPKKEKGGGVSRGQRAQREKSSRPNWAGRAGRREGREKRSFSFSNLIFQIQFQMIFKTF